MRQLTNNFTDTAQSESKLMSDAFSRNQWIRRHESKGWKYFFIHDVLWCIGLMDITLKNDYDFTVWKFGGFRPLKIGIPGVQSRLPDSPAAFARCVSRALSRARFTSRRASAVRNGVFLWSSFVRPSTELPLPERTSPSRSLFTLSTQQSQQRSRSFKSRWCR